MPAISRARKRTTVFAAFLCLAVTWIHIQDQGGIPGNKTPRYVGIGFYLLEATGLICAVLLVLSALSALSGRSRRSRLPWLLATGVALGPLVGYLLSRGPGLPDYTDDRGNWTEPLGLASLAVEAALLAVAATTLLADRVTQPARRPDMREVRKAVRQSR